jgi:hypothetical protein
MFSLHSILSIADFYGWITIIASLVGAIYVYRNRYLITNKYMKRVNKNKEPVEFLFSRPTNSLFYNSNSSYRNKNTNNISKSTPISELVRD